ncbi:hypothetical protein DSTSK_03060 [Desulforhabdus sp. TSK]|nr:hypothetical protein DSTSK_03060 [Desulforhabdus sp. TSK]
MIDSGMFVPNIRANQPISHNDSGMPRLRMVFLVVVMS